MYKELFSPLLDRLDSETCHMRVVDMLHMVESSSLSLCALKLLIEQQRRFTDPRLKVQLDSVEFDNPVMVGAGWDKEGRSLKGLYELGFSGIEVGSVLQYPQRGNEKPRQFVLNSGVILNRLGFNSPGMEIVANNLDVYKNQNIPTGINIGINTGTDSKDIPHAYSTVAKRLYDYGSYFVINVSSPNTPGLRMLQHREPLTDIVQAVFESMEELGKRKPLFIKISPDLDFHSIDEIISIVIDGELSGIVATNTTNRSDIKEKYGSNWTNQEGGLSGDDEEFRHMSSNIIAHIYRETNGSINIIGVGGVMDTQTALEKIMAGSQIVQIVTAIRSEGPRLPGKINRGILSWMERNGVSLIGDIVGYNA